MLAFSYPARFRKDRDGRILVTFPDFPRSATDAAGPAEALEQAIDCLGSAIAFALVKNEEIPRPSEAKRGQRLVPVPMWIAPKLALRWRMLELGVNNSQLARRLGVRETVVRRMLDPDQATRPQTLEAALKNLGQTMVMAVSTLAA